jgi:hypothetical protein
MSHLNKSPFSTRVKENELKLYAFIYLSATVSIKGLSRSGFDCQLAAGIIIVDLNKMSINFNLLQAVMAAFIFYGMSIALLESN